MVRPRSTDTIQINIIYSYKQKHNMASDLQSINYSAPESTDRDLEGVRMVTISSNAASHTPTSNSTLRFNVSGGSREFLDGESVQMYATIATTGTAVKLVASGSLFSQLRILTQGGVEVESIQDANVLNRILRIASSNNVHDNTTGSFSNSQRTVASRATSGRFRIAICDISGFLHGSRLIPLQAAGGYTLELTMAPVASSCEVTGGNATITLTNVKLVAGIVTTTQDYWESFQQQLASGVPYFFTTYRAVSNTINGAGQHSLSLGVRASKVKNVWTVVRPSADINEVVDKSSDAFVSAGYVSHQLTMGGKLYPPQPIDSYAEAHEELLRTVLANKDCKHASLTLGQFSTDWATGGRENGCLVLATDLERSQTVPLSGEFSSGVDTRVMVNFSTIAAPHTCTSFICFDRALTYSAGGQVTVTD